jgi:hypothetical protein
MRAIIVGKLEETERFHESLRGWQRRHNYLNGNLLNSTWPLIPGQHQGPLVLEINMHDPKYSEIVRVAAIAAGIEYYEEVSKY